MCSVARFRINGFRWEMQCRLCLRKQSHAVLCLCLRNLMDTNKLESGDAVFQPRARLLKLIGAELISDEILALAELVKNAHDADASMVTITFRGASGPDGEIVIHDDGDGMDRDTLLRQWMEPAGTTKAGPDGRFT